MSYYSSNFEIGRKIVTFYNLQGKKIPVDDKSCLTKQV